MIVHYNLEFKGYINKIFTFDVRRFDRDIYFESGGETNTDADKYIYEKEDGYLYIQGYKITNNKDGMRTICSNMNTGGMRNSKDECYVDCVFVIDSSGYVICQKHRHSSNKIDLFLQKLLG